MTRWIMLLVLALLIVPVAALPVLTVVVAIMPALGHMMFTLATSAAKPTGPVSDPIPR